MTLVKPLHETVMDQIAWATSDHPRIQIGFPIFDDRAGGIAEGEVLLFTARSQVGKTIFACNVINNNADIPTVFFSLEMHGRYIAHRLAAIHADAPTEGIEKHLVATGEAPLYNELVRDFPQLVIPDKPAMSLRDMSEAMRDATAIIGERPKLVVIDFMELIGGASGMNGAVEQVDKVARKVKDFTREHDCSTVLLHQVSRGAGENGDQALSLTSGRYGGEVSADYVMAAYRPCLADGISQEEYERTQDQFYMQFLKTRSSGGIHPGGVRYHLDPHSMRLSEYQPPIFRPLQPLQPALV